MTKAEHVRLPTTLGILWIEQKEPCIQPLQHDKDFHQPSSTAAHLNDQPFQKESQGVAMKTAVPSPVHKNGRSDVHRKIHRESAEVGGREKRECCPITTLARMCPGAGHCADDVFMHCTLQPLQRSHW